MPTRATSTTTRTSAVETRSIDYVPADERHGQVWRQGPFWFLGNFQPFTLSLGLIGPSIGLDLWWTVLASVLGIVFGPLFMAFHATQGPVLGLPQMVQSRAQFGLPRGGGAPGRHAVHLRGLQRGGPGDHQGGPGRHLRLGRDRGGGRDHRDRHGAGGLRPRLAAPGVHRALRGVHPALRRAHGRGARGWGHGLRPGRRARLHVGRVPGPVHGRRGVQRHLRARTSPTTPATCRRGRGRAPSSPRSSSAPSARRSG